jgi:para-nitrobenzyl esterase
MHQGEISEDCLYLNVWSPESSGRHPVMFWIHGGGFKSGSSATALVDGEAMARKGIVVVTINYRVGVLGFLAHPELSKESAAHVSGNYGLLDQIAALQWVQTNIEAFGGDPARVTVAGQSAGAMSVLILAASPLTKGLFHQAIAQSGNIDGSRLLADAETAGAKFMAAKGARTVHEMRAMSVAKLIAPVPQVPGPNGPVLDRWLLQDEHTRDIATLTGWTADEGSAGVNYSKASESQKEYWREQQMLSLFMWAKQRAAASKTPVYTYFWNHAPPGPMKRLYGAFHSSEMFYMFDNLGKAERPWTPADREIAEKVSNYWANFILTGNPNGTGLPKWPAFDSERPVTMELGDRFMPRPISGAAK